MGYTRVPPLSGSGSITHVPTSVSPIPVSDAGTTNYHQVPGTSGIVNQPPSALAPTLSASDLTQSSGTYIVNDGVLLTATTADATDLVTTTGVSLYESGVLIGAMFQVFPGTWYYVVDPLTTGAKSYTARRTYSGGTIDSSAVAISAVSPSASPVWQLDPMSGILIDVNLNASGGGASTDITLGGTRTFSIDVRIQIDLNGTRGTAKFSYGYMDETKNLIWIETGLTTDGAGTPYTFIGALAGMTIVFAAAVTFNTAWTYRGRIASWTDSLGNAWTSPGGTAMPSFNPGTDTGGVPVVVMDGTNDKLVCSSSTVFGFMSGAGKTHEYELLAQVFPQSTGANSFFLSFANTASDTGFWDWGIVSTGGWIAGCNDGAGKNATSAAANDQENHLFNWRSSGTACTLQTDQFAADPNAAAQNPGTITLNTAAIGVNNRLTNNGFFNGGIGRVLMFSSQLTSTERFRWSTVLRCYPAVLTTQNNDASVKLITDRARCAGIISVLHSATQIASAADHGRGFQISANCDRDLYGAGGYNPTEQGSNADGAGNTTHSVSHSRVVAPDLSYSRVVTRPAFWYVPGLGAQPDAPLGSINGTQPSNWEFERRVTANWLSNKNIFRWDTRITVPSDFQQSSGTPDFRLLVSENIAVYLINSVFGVDEDYHADGTLTTIPAGDMSSAGPTFRATPPVISNAGGTHAVGIYNLTHSDATSKAFLSRAGDYRVTDYTPGFDIINPDCQIPAYFGASRIPAGQYHFITFACIGTKTEVLTAMDLLRTTYGYPT